MINSSSSMNETTSKINPSQLVDSTSGSKSFSSMGDINMSQNPMNNASNINTAGLNQQYPAAQKKEEPGIFGRFANLLNRFLLTICVLTTAHLLIPRDGLQSQNIDIFSPMKSKFAIP